MEEFEVEYGLDEFEIEPDDDAAPGSIQPVVYLSTEGERRIAPMRWGFSLPDRFLFNARSEGIDRSRFWQEAFHQRRCLVPADSFFEWTHEPARAKRKFEFTLQDSALFGMAALWSPWLNPRTNQWENTFSILTGEANEVMLPIHSRQPEIISRRDYEEFLTNAPRPPLHLLRILPSEQIKATPVSEKVQSPQGIFFDAGTLDDK